jgi:undecaprenyl-diphosphatase
MIFDFLYQIDLTIFYFINHTLSNPVFDFIFPLLTNAFNFDLFRWVLLPLALIFWVYRGKMKALRCMLLAILLAVICDASIYRVIKAFSYRTRPHLVLSDAKLRLEHSPKSSSLPSNHAVSTMAVALLLAWYYPRRKYIFISFAILVGFTRVYVGVHYPSDVLFGWLCGWGIYWLLHKFIFSRIDYCKP